MAKQRRKRCIPKISKKGRVDKSRERQRLAKPHANKYKDKQS